MTILIATRGAKHGTCNICGEIGPLTEDHTPPKGCLAPKQVELNHIAHLLSGGPQSTKGRTSQNGVKYRTLCKRCNNTLLGGRYDRHFISFVNAVGSILKSCLPIPDTLQVKARPQAILRALIGHVAAQGIDRYLKGPLTEPIRDYFLNDSESLPSGLNVFYWAYPFRPHLMVRDAVYVDLPSQEVFSFWMLKFFPLAFLVTWGEPVGLNYPIHSFEEWRSSAIDLEVEMTISLSPVPPMYWPEAPTRQSMVVYGQEAIFVKS